MKIDTKKICDECTRTIELLAMVEEISDYLAGSQLNHLAPTEDDAIMALQSALSARLGRIVATEIQRATAELEQLRQITLEMK